MSHVANVEVEINDLASLKVACHQLGVEFREGQKSYEWYGEFLNDWNSKNAAVNNGYDSSTFGTCEHAIHIPGVNYEVGVVKNPNGTGYRLQYDSWGGGGSEGKAIQNKLGGMHLSKMKTEYSAAVATKFLQRQGYRGVVRRVLANGKIQIKGSKF